MLWKKVKKAIFFKKELTIFKRVLFKLYNKMSVVLSFKNIKTSLALCLVQKWIFKATSFLPRNGFSFQMFHQQQNKINNSYNNYNKIKNNYNKINNNNYK